MVKVLSVTAVLASLAAFITTAHAGMVENALRERITASLESLQAVAGIQNCENKCQNAFARFAYQVSTTPNELSYEFQACIDGCNRCEQQRAQDQPADTCFLYCKNRNWHNSNIVKGVIEPDKACLGGCVINTCQALCTGGTTQALTPQTEQFYWPTGGCSIKTEPYSQNLEYVPWDSPNTGQGGSEDAAQCCANSVSLCFYQGALDENYQNLLRVTVNSCRSFVSQANRDRICAWARNPQNCGDTNVFEA